MAKRKPKVEFEFKCESCGHLQEPDQGQSNENWSVFPSKCSKCGEKVKMSIK